jgi:hypothetical protein
MLSTIVPSGPGEGACDLPTHQNGGRAITGIRALAGVVHDLSPAAREVPAKPPSLL